jgi:Zn-dependent protease
MALGLAIALVFSAVTPSYAFLDKTRFVVHLGIAYFCFHHWVLKPYQEGAFANGAPHRVATIVKAGAALLFAYHEVRVAHKIAVNSNSPLLQKLDGGLTALQSQFSTIGAKLKGGSFDPKDIASLTALTAGFSSLAAAHNLPIKDVAIPDLNAKTGDDDDSSASPAPMATST